MRIMPGNLQNAYDLLSACQPFDVWNLPHSDDVKFHVTGGGRDKKTAGAYYYDDGHHIDISRRHHTSLHLLLVTMAHEMIHLHERVSGISAGSKSQHSEAFKMLALEVADGTGFHQDELLVDGL